ncbi:MAG: peptide deformylase, partial [Sulfuricella sp.]
MAIKTVLRMGDPRLLEKAVPVAVFDTPELHQLLQDMRDTMAALSGAGLAALQVGIGLQVVVFGMASNPRYPDAEQVPDTVLINPVLTPLGDEMDEGWEGCLSIPGLRG